MNRLTKDFYIREDVVRIAKELLGKVLVTTFDGNRTSGKIVETEAYWAPEDRASHAYNNRRTARTDIMFWEGGHAYIYLNYGIHHLFNVVTGREGMPHAILIRALEPIEGMKTMLARRNLTDIQPRLTAGPGSLSKALGITKAFHGQSLLLSDSPIWLEDMGEVVLDKEILASPRVGIAYAEEWVQKPWRFRVRNSEWTSPAK